MFWCFAASAESVGSPFGGIESSSPGGHSQEGETKKHTNSDANLQDNVQVTRTEDYGSLLYAARVLVTCVVAKKPMADSMRRVGGWSSMNVRK